MNDFLNILYIINAFSFYRIKLFKMQGHFLIKYLACISFLKNIHIFWRIHILTKTLRYGQKYFYILKK